MSQNRPFYTTYLDTAKCVQVCSNCVSQVSTRSQIMRHDRDVCSSFCETCFSEKSVCASCKETGHSSHLPAFRACDRCILDGVKCTKAAVLLVVSDCEQKNKTAMEDLNGDKVKIDNPFIAQAAAIPDVVHVGKSMKCSFSNWFILLEGQRSNLVLLRTLRDFGVPSIKNVLRKSLTLECFRNKDRTAVEPVIKRTRESIITALEGSDGVVHTILPERYKFWKSNQVGNYPPLIDVCTGKYGHLLVLVHDQGSEVCQLLESRLPYPVDVSVTSSNVKDARSICFAKPGVAYVVERNTASILFFLD